MKNLLAILIVILTSCAAPHSIKGFEKKTLGEAASQIEQTTGNKVDLKECDVYVYNLENANSMNLQAQGIYLENLIPNYSATGNVQFEKITIAVVVHKSAAYGFLAVGTQVFGYNEVNIYKFVTKTEPISYTKGTSLNMNLYDTYSTLPTIVTGFGSGASMVFNIVIDSTNVLTTNLNIPLSVD